MAEAKKTSEKKEAFTKNEIESGKAMSILSYIGILVFIPFFAEKQNKYVQYHAKQGMNLLILVAIAYVALWILNAILIFIPILGWILMTLLNIGVYGCSVAAMIIGIVYACQGKAQELPVIGKIKFIK